MNGLVSVAVPVSYRRWQAPNFATIDRPPGNRQDGMQPLPSTPVAELDPKALDALAAAWIEDLYTKAGRKPPKLQSGGEAGGAARAVEMVIEAGRPVIVPIGMQ